MDIERRRFEMRPALLKSESQEEFAALLDNLNEDIQPRNVVERLYTYDVANLVWDEIRYRRAKAGLLNKTAMYGALTNVIRSIIFGPGDILKSHNGAETLAYNSLFSDEIRGRVSSMLEEVQLDSSHVEAEAVRLHLDEIERLDRLIEKVQSLRTKAICNIALTKKNFAEMLLSSTDRLLSAATDASNPPPGTMLS